MQARFAGLAGKTGDNAYKVLRVSFRNRQILSGRSTTSSCEYAVLVQRLSGAGTDAAACFRREKADFACLCGVNTRMLSIKT